MNIIYPFQGNTAGMLFRNIDSNNTGTYPVGIGHFWHGGVHLTIPQAVRAICDGEVVAYRIDEDYLEDLAMERWDGTNNKYSTGFVLVRHKLKYPPESDKTITFFSLYMHLLPWKLYGKKEKEKKPPFFKTTRYYAEREMNIRDISCKNTNFDPRKAEKLGIIKKNEEIFFENDEDPDKKMRWDGTYKYRHLDPKKHGYEAGYIHVPHGNYRKETNTPMKFAVGDKNNIVIPDPPMPVKCGEVIGYPGKHDQDNMIHFEIFMDDVSFMDNPDSLKKDDPDDVQKNQSDPTKVDSDAVTKNPANPQTKKATAVKNLYNWIADKYFDKITDINDDCYCDLDILKDMLLKSDYIHFFNIKRIKNLPALMKKPRVMDYCKLVACRHATEWSTKADGSTKKWDLLLDYPWEVKKERLESVILPHIRRLQWWDHLEKAKVKDLPKDSRKVWFFHPISFIQHWKRIFGIFWISMKGINLLHSIEVARLKPYDDQTGKEVDSWVQGATIGYGHLIRQEEWSKYGNGLTTEQINALFDQDLSSFVEAVGSVVKIDLAQNQFDALVILAYNIGIDAFRTSSVLKLVNDPSAVTGHPSLEAAWKSWSKSQGKVMQGLVNRRHAEWKIYSKNIYEKW